MDGLLFVYGRFAASRASARAATLGAAFSDKDGGYILSLLSLCLRCRFVLVQQLGLQRLLQIGLISILFHQILFAILVRWILLGPLPHKAVLLVLRSSLIRRRMQLMLLIRILHNSLASPRILFSD